MTVDTKAIRARFRLATPPPWSIEVDGLNDVLFVVCDHNTKPWNYTDAATDFDRAFINAARSDVPALCDEVDRLRGEIDRVVNSFMDGEHDCNVCGRVTANGTCTECRHGVSPLLKARADNDRLRAAITQALVQLQPSPADVEGATVVLREAIGIGVGP